MLISIGYMCLMLCAPLDWQYAELPSSASDAVLCSVLVRKMWDKKNEHIFFNRWHYRLFLRSFSGAFLLM